MSDKAITQYLGQCENQLSRFAPDGTEIGTWLQTVHLCISESSEISRAIQTDQGKASVFHALKFAASTGLSLNPQQGKCALIAYGNKVQYMIMKAGWIELALNSGKVDYLGSDIVRENDQFSVTKSMDGDRFVHQIATIDRGPLIGAYAALKESDGTGHVVYMTIDELEQHRDAYAASKNGPWVNSFPGMSIKTVIKKLLRNTHLSDRVSAAVGADDKTETETQPTNKGTSAGALGALIATAEVINDDNDKDQKEEQGTTNTELLHRQDVPGEVDSTSEGQGAFALKSDESDY